MNTLQMHYFLAVADNENLTETAENLLISPAALSKAISRFEKDLGARLFDRSATGMTLNENGIMAYETIAQVAALIDNLQYSLKSNARINNMSINIISAAGLSCSDLIAAFSIENPSIHMLFNHSSVPHLKPADLLDSFDFLISPLDIINDESLNRIKLLQLKPTVLINKSHPLAAGSSVSIAEIAKEPFISSTTDAWTTYIKQLFENYGFTLNCIMECTYSIRILLVSKGLGFTVIAQNGANVSTLPDDIKALPISDDCPPYELYLFWHHNRRQTEAMRLFLNFSKNFYMSSDSFDDTHNAARS